jgi:hypothetical protein
MEPSILRERIKNSGDHQHEHESKAGPSTASLLCNNFGRDDKIFAELK